MQAEVKLQVLCKTQYISGSMLLIYLFFESILLWVLLSSVINTAAAGGKCCLQTQNITALSPGWQFNHLPGFRAHDGSALEPHSALSPASPVNYARLCPAARGSWNGKDTQSTCGSVRLRVAHRDGRAFLSTHSW